MLISIRADGNDEIGFGHLTRTSALAEVLLEKSIDVTVVTATPHAARNVFPEDAIIVPVSNRSEPEPFCDWLESAPVDAVFTDSYTVDTEYQQAIRDRVPLAVLQDDARHAINADLFINGNIYANEFDYKFVGENPRTYLGIDYVLLREEIRTLTTYEPPWRTEAARALVTMGGSDTAERTPTVVRAFDGSDLRVDAIVGPGFSRQQEREIRDAAADVTADVRVVRDPEDLPQRMFKADFGVTTASSTTYELLALGTPFVCQPVADNQVPIASALRERDVATVLGAGEGEESFRHAIREYETNVSLRHERQDEGRSLVDGQGAERLYTKILSLTEEIPGP